jgi:Alpha-(1->3)-arabinofuranosyltransferase
MSNDDAKGISTIIYSSFTNKRDSILLIIIFWAAVSTILTVFVIRDMIWNPGFIYSRDFILPTDLSLTYSDLTDTWDNLHSHRNLELNKIPLFVLLSTVDEVIGSENTQKLFLGTVIFSVLFVIFLSLLLVFKEKVNSNIKLIAICAPPSLLYLFNPWVVDRISNHIFMVLGMALTPLIIITYVSLLNRGGGRGYLKIFLASLLLTGLSIVSTHNIHYIVPILLFISAYYIIVASNKERKKVLLSSVLFFCLYIGLNSYWIIPIAYEFYSAEIQPAYNFSVNQIERLSQLNTFPNVVQMIGGGAWNLPLMFQNEISYYLGFLIPIISLSAIGLFPSNKFIILLAIMLVGLLVLALGTNSPFRYWELGFPISDVMWLFRDPSRLIQFIVLIYAIFLAFTIYRIISSKKKLSRLISILLISFILISVGTSFSTYTFVNSAGGRFAPSTLPAALTDLESFLHNDTGNYKVLWLPLRTYLTYEWNKANDEIAGNIYVQSSPKATYDSISSQASRDIQFLGDLNSNIFLELKTDKIGQILNIYGIKYVIVFTDLVERRLIEAERIIRNLDQQQDMSLVNQFGPYYVYRNSVFDSDNAAQFYASTMSAAQFYASTMSAAISNYSVIERDRFLAALRTETEKSPDPELQVIHQSPTHYLLRVNSTTPFLLVFTETYDPLWKIKIDSSRSASSIPAYYFLNGFAIDEPGQHMIEIEYTPQTWFNIGVVISLTTLLMFLGYWMICVFRGVLSLRSIGIGNNSYILSETFAYQDILMRLRDTKRYFSKKS